MLTRAVVDVGVVWSHRVPKPHGADLPTGAPTNAAFFDAWPVHGLAFATPAATARRAQVLIMMWCMGRDTEQDWIRSRPAGSGVFLPTSFLNGVGSFRQNHVVPPKIESSWLEDCVHCSVGVAVALFVTCPTRMAR